MLVGVVLEFVDIGNVGGYFVDGVVVFPRVAARAQS